MAFGLQQKEFCVVTLFRWAVMIPYPELSNPNESRAPFLACDRVVVFGFGDFLCSHLIKKNKLLTICSEGNHTVANCFGNFSKNVDSLEHSITTPVL